MSLPTGDGYRIPHKDMKGCCSIVTIPASWLWNTGVVVDGEVVETPVSGCTPL